MTGGHPTKDLASPGRQAWELPAEALCSRLLVAVFHWHVVINLHEAVSTWSSTATVVQPSRMVARWSSSAELRDVEEALMQASVPRRTDTKKGHARYPHGMPCKPCVS